MNKIIGFFKKAPIPIETTFLTQIPTGPRFQLLSYLQVTDLRNCKITCKEWKIILSDPENLRLLFLQKTGLDKQITNLKQFECWYFIHQKLCGNIETPVLEKLYTIPILLKKIMLKKDILSSHPFHKKKDNKDHFFTFMDVRDLVIVLITKERDDSIAIKINGSFNRSTNNILFWNVQKNFDISNMRIDPEEQVSKGWKYLNQILGPRFGFPTVKPTLCSLLNTSSHN